jgi:hypothetical protein
VTPLLRAQAALAFIGVALFGWSIYADDERVRLAAIGTLAVALVLRFVRRAAARRNEDAT